VPVDQQIDASKRFRVLSENFDRIGLEQVVAHGKYERPIEQ
jgi:hypothetical protein